MHTHTHASLEKCIVEHPPPKMWTEVFSAENETTMEDEAY